MPDRDRRRSRTAAFGVVTALTLINVVKKTLSERNLVDASVHRGPLSLRLSHKGWWWADPAAALVIALAAARAGRAAWREAREDPAPATPHGAASASRR